ncbi:MAG: hypothetical protein MGF17_00010 [Trichodesmium sp. MAG_R04]|nr:hypothetical protein [Trichodesmium sp. MAG_R04]
MYDYSDSNFTIEPEEFITVTSPNEVNSLEPGRSYCLDWEDNISENVKLGQDEEVASHFARGCPQRWNLNFPQAA